MRKKKVASPCTIQPAPSPCRRCVRRPLPSVGEGRERGKNATQAAGVGRLQAAHRRGPATTLKAQTIKEDERKNLKASPSPCPSPTAGGGDQLRAGRARVRERVDDGNGKGTRKRIYWSEGILPSNVLPPEAGDLNPSPLRGRG